MEDDVGLNGRQAQPVVPWTRIMKDACPVCRDPICKKCHGCKCPDLARQCPAPPGCQVQQ